MCQNMKIKNLDEIIQECHCVMKECSTIDINNKYEDISLGSILNDIELISTKMVLGQGKIAVSEDTEIQPIKIVVNRCKDNIIRKFIKKIDKKLLKIDLYVNNIRPKLQRHYLFFNSELTVKAKDLMKFNDTEFVQAAYQAILLRDVDDDAKTNCLEGLRNGSINKLNIITTLQNSIEGKSKYIRVSGLGKYKLIAKLKKIRKIPVIGYLLQVLWGLITYPIKIKKQEDINR